MLRFVDRLVNRLKKENRRIYTRNELDLYLMKSNYKIELQQIAKEKIEIAITKIYKILILLYTHEQEA